MPRTRSLSALPGWCKSLRKIAAPAAVMLWTGALHSPPAVADPAIPSSTCLPENVPESSSWPVKLIYLHGWFAPSGPSDVAGNRAVEFANRGYLDEFARRYRIRIAAPLGLQVEPANGMLEWGRADLPQIEQSSLQACHVSELPPGISLIGFSNGGFKARDIGLLPCESLGSYFKILAVGTETRFPDRCGGKFLSIPEHKFPPDDLGSLLNLELPAGRGEQGITSKAGP
jgi:hypothetical protein